MIELLLNIFRQYYEQLYISTFIVASSLFISGLDDDFPIWANKVHKHRPVFCKEDKTLVQFRKWVRQFYLTSQDQREIA